MQNVVLKGKKVTIRTIEESDIKHYGISYLKKKVQNGRNGCAIFPVLNARILIL